MLIAPVRTRTPTPLWSINILIYCTHIKKIERLLTHCECGCTCVHLSLDTYTPQEVPSNPLHYITNNNGCFRGSHAIVTLKQTVYYVSIYQLVFYIYISLYIHSFVKPLEHLHLPTLPFLWRNIPTFSLPCSTPTDPLTLVIAQQAKQEIASA